MIHDLKPFPAYRDSGVDWLGKVPTHWEVRRLRSTVTNCQNGVWGDEPDGAHDIPCVRVADFDRVALRTTMADPTLRSMEQRVVSSRGLHAGDLLLEKSGGGENQPVGVVVLYDHEGAAVCSNFIARMTVADGYHPRFLTYLHAALYALRVNTRHIKQSTGIQNLDSAGYLGEAAGFPETAEQRAIAAFLDHVDRRIRRCIHAKQKLIALLHEQRQAIIRRAVTRGLAPSVRLKPSGLEWLGDVPEHWEVMPLKHFTPQVTVGIVVQPARLYVDSGVPCLRSLNISTGTIRTDSLVYISHETNTEQRKSRIFAGDVVVVRTGQAGVAAIVTPEFDGANCIDLLIVRKSTKVLSEYLLTYLNSWPIRTDVQYRAVGAIQAHYNTSTLANLVIAAPPIPEQQRILDDLRLQLSPIDDLAMLAQREISLLREYRTRLIADVVTGKLDVREAAAHLPEETGEPEPLDDTDTSPEDISEETEPTDLDAALEEAEA